MAVAFSGLSIACYCLPLGIVGALLGNAEVAAIDRGESPEAGRGYATAAKWIGVVTGSISIVGGVIVGIAALVGAMS